MSDEKTTTSSQSFATREDATKWMYAKVDDPYIDNERFAFEGDEAANEVYESQVDSGCCGSFDANIAVDGRPARIGCNYGH